jgi:hypothetical protein
VTPIGRLSALCTVTIVLLASLNFAVMAQATTSAGQRHHGPTVSLSDRKQSSLTTAWTSANCSINAYQVQESGGGEIKLSQAPNGDLSGCFRVPSLQTSKLVVALQAYANRTVPASTKVVTKESTSPSDGNFTLSTSSHNVKPGETLILTVNYVGQHPSQIDGTPALCWDSCQSGLLEESNVAHWVTHSEFRVAFQVPTTAWFEENGKRASFHPLISGDYSVGIACIVVTSDCALEPADAQVIVHLTAHTSRCLSERKCAYLTLSSKVAQVGDVISVRGWAPVQTVVGSPAGLSLTVTNARKNQSYAPFSATVVSKGAFSLVFARRAFAIRPDETWADLGHLRAISSTWSGVSAVSPLAGSPRIAWCLPTSIEVTGGSSNQRIPTNGVLLALEGTNLKSPGPAQPEPQCSSVMLDPRRASTVYAGFFEAINGSAPPENLVGMYSLNSGTTWQTVPAPPGLNVDDFAGFVRDAQGVAAIFYNPYSEESGVDSDVTIAIELSTNSGRTWTPSTLGCLAVGPCVGFGPYEWVNCAMGGTGQPFLVGSPTTSIQPGKEVWSSTTWVTLVNTCFSQQLVAVSTHRVLLLDPSSPYPLLQSGDGGTTWSNIDLPTIPGSTLSDANPSDDNSLLLASNGALFASLTNPAGTKQELFRLDPAAAKWCVVPKVFGTFTSVGVLGPLRSSGNDVAWMQTVYGTTSDSNARTTLHLRTVSSLQC